MTDYPRIDAPQTARRPFLPDGIVAALRLALLLASTVQHFLVFERRWALTAPDVPLIAWAPPLASHVTTQIASFLVSAVVCAGVGSGRRWAFLITMLNCLGGIVLALILRSSSWTSWVAFAIDLLAFVYCGLRLFGSIGP